MGDLPDVWATVDSSRERLEPWMPWIDGTRTIDDQARWLASVVDDGGTLDGCGIFVDGRYVGGVGLSWDPLHGKGGECYWIAVSDVGAGVVIFVLGVGGEWSF